MGSLEKLAEIDLELESFGKSDELLGGVLRLARELAPQGLEAIDVALAELGVAAPIEARRRVETVLPVDGDAKPGTWERPERSEPFPDEGSGLVEVPDEILRAEPLPAVLELDPELLGAAPERMQAEQVQLEQMQAEQMQAEPAVFDDTTDIRDPQSLETELLGDEHDTGEMALASSASSSEVAVARDDAPLADLFDDAPPPSPPADAPLSNLFDLFDDPLPLDDGGAAIDGGLADLFDESVRPEAEPAAHEDLSDLLSTELRSAMDEPERGSLAGDELDEEPEQTAIFTSDEMRALRSSPPPDAEDGSLDAQLDALVGEPVEEASSSDDFELMIDEDVLALEDAELEGAELEVDPTVAADESAARPSQAPSSPSQPPKGFFSRILNRK